MQLLAAFEGLGTGAHFLGNHTEPVIHTRPGNIPSLNAQSIHDVCVDARVSSQKPDISLHLELPGIVAQELNRLTLPKKHQ